MLACLIVVVVLMTSGAFKLHLFEWLEAKPRNLLSATVRSAIGTAFLILQPRINAASTEQFLAALAILGVPDDAKANQARRGVQDHATYHTFAFEMNFVSARIRESVPQLTQRLLARIEFLDDICINDEGVDGISP